MKINLYFIAHSRQHALERTCEEIYRISDKNKKQISIKVLNDGFCNHDLMRHLDNKFKNNNIEFENIILKNPQYFQKSIYMSQQDSEYIIKCDEDIFLTTDGWNKFFDDLDKVNWGTTGCYAPLITSGIPGIELFLDLYVDENTRMYFREQFENTKIDNLWGAVYEALSYKKDNPYDFFVQVGALEHYYKGIHPLRVSSYLQNLLIDYILATPHWRNPSGTFNMTASKPAYFCNSVFLMQTAEYKKAVDGMIAGEYVMDGFDEVGMNQHISKTGKYFIFNTNSVAVHPSYNTIGMDWAKISNKFYENI